MIVLAATSELKSPSAMRIIGSGGGGGGGSQVLAHNCKM